MTGPNTSVMLFSEVSEAGFYRSTIVSFKDFELLGARIELGLLLLHHQPSSIACWVDMRWLRVCQQRESESEPEKSKTQLTKFGQGRAESKRQERAPPAVQRERQQKVSNIHTQSKHQTSSNTQNETLWSPWLHRKPASLENPPNVN